MSKKVIVIISSVVVLGGLGIWWFLKGSDKHLQLIPADATFVATFDFASLGNKLEMDKIKELNWYKAMMEDMKESSSDEAQTMREALENPFNVGINFMSEFYFFNHNKDKVSYTGVAFDVRNEDDLEKTILKINNKQEIIKEEGLRMIEFGSGLCAWNGQGGVIISDTDYGDDAEMNLKTYVKSLFTQGKGASIASNDHFHSLMKNKKDINIFVNGRGYAALLDGTAGSILGFNNMGNSASLIKDTYSLATLDFQDDAILMESFAESDSPEYEKMMEIGGEGVSAELQQYCTPQRIFGIAAMSFNQQKFVEFLKSIPAVQRNMESMLAELQWTEADLTEAVSGEIIASLNDVRMTQVPQLPPLTEEQIGQLPFEQMLEYQMQAYRRPEPYAVFSVSIRSNAKNKWKELFARIGERIQLMPVGDGLYVAAASGQLPNVYVVETPIGFTLTNDSLWMVQCKNGGSQASAQAIQPYLNKGALSVYMDMNLANYPKEFTDYMNDENMFTSYVTTYLSLFNNLRWEGNMKGGKMTLTLQPGDGNSLYQLLAQVAKVKDEMDRREAERQRELPPMDDVAIEAPQVEQMPED